MDGILSGTMSFVRLWEGNFRFEREWLRRMVFLDLFVTLYIKIIRLESVEKGL